MLTLADAPVASDARSVSVILALISISERSTISATLRPGCTVSPSRYSGSVMPLKKKPPLASWFSFMTTRPVSGALTTMLSIVRCANCIAPCALFRFS